MTAGHLLKGSMTGAAQLLVNTLLMAVAIPVFLHTLGIEAYGVFSLLMVVGNLNTFAALGLNAALVRTIAQQGKTPESDRDIAVTLILFVAVTIPMTVVAAALTRFAVRDVFGISPTYQADASILFLSFLCANAFLLVGQVFIAVLDARQQVHHSNLLQIAYNGFYWGLMLCVLLLALPLAAVGIVAVIAAILWFAAAAVTARRSWGSLRLAGLVAGFVPSAKKQLSVGLQIYLANMIGFFHEPLTRILLSRYVGVSEVGMLDIALKLRNQVWGVINRALYPVFPLLSRLQDKKEIRRITLELEHATVLAVVPIIGVTASAVFPLVSLWIGLNVVPIAVAAAVMTSAYLIGSSTIYPYYQYLLAKGNPSKTVLLQILNVSVNALVFVVAARWLGYWAAVAGGACAILTSGAVTFAMQRVEFGTLQPGAGRQAVLMAVALAASVTVGLAVGLVLPSDVLRLVISPAAAFMTVLSLYRVFGLVSSADINRFFAGRPVLVRSLERLLCRTL